MATNEDLWSKIYGTGSNTDYKLAGLTTMPGTLGSNNLNDLLTNAQNKIKSLMLPKPSLRSTPQVTAPMIDPSRGPSPLLKVPGQPMYGAPTQSVLNPNIGGTPKPATPPQAPMMKDARYVPKPPPPPQTPQDQIINQKISDIVSGKVPLPPGVFGGLNPWDPQNPHAQVTPGSLPGWENALDLFNSGNAPDQGGLFYGGNTGIPPMSVPRKNPVLGGERPLATSPQWASTVQSWRDKILGATGKGMEAGARPIQNALQKPTPPIPPPEQKPPEVTPPGPEVTGPSANYQPWNQYWQSVKGTMNPNEAVKTWIKDIMPLKNAGAAGTPGAPPPAAPAATPVTPELFNIYKGGIEKALGDVLTNDPNDLYQALMSGQIKGGYGTDAFYGNLKSVMDQVATGQLTNPADISKAINDTFGTLWSSIAGSGTTVPKEYEQAYKDTLAKAASDFTNNLLWGTQLSPYKPEEPGAGAGFTLTGEEGMLKGYLGNVLGNLMSNPASFGQNLQLAGGAQFVKPWQDLINGVKTGTVGVQDVYDQVSNLVTGMYESLIPGKSASDPDLQAMIQQVATSLLMTNWNPQTAANTMGGYQQNPMGNILGMGATSGYTPTYLGENYAGSQMGNPQAMGGLPTEQALASLGMTQQDFINYLVNNAMGGFQNQFSSLMNPQYLSTPTVQSGLFNWQNQLGAVV